MYDCKAPLSRFYYPDTRRIINAFIIIIISLLLQRHFFSGANTQLSQCHAWLCATQYSAACQTHIRCTLNCTARGMQATQAGREAVKERGRMENGREGARGWGGRE